MIMIAHCSRVLNDASREIMSQYDHMSVFSSTRIHSNCIAIVLNMKIEVQRN